MFFVFVLDFLFIFFFFYCTIISLHTKPFVAEKHLYKRK